MNWLAGVTLSPPKYLIGIFTHLKLCLANAIHNFKCVKIIQIRQNGGQLFLNLAKEMSRFIFNMCQNRVFNVLIKKVKHEYNRHRR